MYACMFSCCTNNAVFCKLIHEFDAALKTNIVCDFSDQYICGYQQVDHPTLDWNHVTTDNGGERYSTAGAKFNGNAS